MPIDFNRFPYYDDFTKDNQFYRLLFQPGRSVQARELTQIQSLLQSQIDNLGKHLFDEGARVHGGTLNYKRDSEKWIAVKAQDAHGNPVRVRDMTPGLLIRKPKDASDVNAVHGKITSIIPSEGEDPNTIYFQWVIEPDNPNVDGFLPNEMLQICDSTSGAVRYNVTTLDVNSVGASIHYGTSASISVEPGLYFYNGLFVQSVGGSVRLSKYTNVTNYRVGFAVNEEVVTDDPRSLDPAQHASNYSAPGADRYKINLTLVKIGDGISIDDRSIPDFIEVCRIVDGNLIAANDGTNDLYNILAEQMARRTYEESGNYVAKPYDLVLSDRSGVDNPEVKARMAEGVAYVRGFRHSLNERSVFAFNKAREGIQDESNMPNAYGDNFLYVYDHANTNVTHPENANGLFTVGSGAGEDVSTADYALRGEAVEIHCVPQELVKNHSLTSNDTWHSTLVGTARPIQQVYNKTKSLFSNSVGRTGDVYNLWMGDFKSSPIANTLSGTNVIEKVSAAGNTTFTTYTFAADTTHGITANDRISVVGSTNPYWNTDLHKVAGANTTALTIAGAKPSGALPARHSLTLYRTTGNTDPLQSVVLDQDSSAAWNGSYIGASIQVGNSAPRKVVDYIGTHSTAETLYHQRYGFSKRGMVILDKPLDEAPKTGDKYTLNLGMKQARSVVFNQNKSATGVNQYPAILNQSWNVDPISGVEGGSIDKLIDDVYGKRIDGDTLYNRYGESSAEEDALLFHPKRAAIKTYETFGALDTGLTSNTNVIYTEYALKTRTGTAGATETFAPPSASAYNYFNRPKPWPFDANFDSNNDGLDHVKENFILVNRTKGTVLTNEITRLVVTPASHSISITSATNFIQNDTYLLLFPVRAEFVTAAYKKLIKANTSHSIVSSLARKRETSLSDFDNGHVFFANATYDTGVGARLSLGKPDGFKLHAVIQNLPNADANNQIANTADQALATPFYHITDHFTFHTGQRDMFYDNAYIELKNGYNAPTGNVLVIFDRFERMDKPKSDDTRAKDISSPSFFSVDSYQWTTDLTLDHSPSQAAIEVGTKVKTNTNIVGYAVDYANTGTGGVYSKVRLQGVTGPPGASGEFEVGQVVSWFDATSSSTLQGTIKTVVSADLGYSEIPIYRSAGQVNYPLRNMLDFRPYAVTNNMVSDTLADASMPLIPTLKGIVAGRWDGSTISPMTNKLTTPVVYDHFAGRIDKIVVTKDGNYTNIKGNPAVIPFPPKDAPSDDSLTLFQVNIPPYTFSPKDIEIKPTFAMRHTMKDIGRLAKRVENLEYYVSLNALEKAASDMDIRFKSDGTSRFKNGIVVDNFMGSMVMDFLESTAATGTGFLRPQVEQPDNAGSYHFVPDRSTSFTGLKTHYRDYTVDDGSIGPDHGTITTLDYNIEPMITQASATTAESVNPFDLQNFTGELKLTPDKDTWIDITKVPEYNSFINNTLDSIAGVDENSTVATIMGAIRSIDEFWVDVAGNKSIGDDPALHGTSFYRDDLTSQTESISRDISLGNVRDQYFNTTPIDAAIATHGLTDGVTKNIKILPYIRSRDVIVNARGLKPNHLNSMIFDGTSVENHFAQANRIYMNYDPQKIRRQNTDLTGKLFQPDIDGTYEKIKLSSGGKSANAILLAVREAELQNGITNGPNSRYMVGYIVPEFNPDTGLIDYSTFADGYYSGWSDSEIRAHGFQGYFGEGTSSVTGYNSEATAGLIAWGGSSSIEPQKYNGHYTGTARNSSSNTTHIVLSPDAHRYRAGNFKKTAAGDTSTYDGAVPEKTIINIVAGAGAGQQCVANGLAYFDASGRPVIELRAVASGETGISTNNPINGTSVYTIGMKHVDPKNPRYNGIAKIGDTPSRSNHYGEKMGVLRIPSTSKVKFTTGRKLVEVADRFGKQEWLITSYASANYSADGKEVEQVESSPERLELLREIRSRSNMYRILDHPDDTGVIPATNNDDGSSGILAVVTGLEIANGTWTAHNTHGITFVQGGGEYGTVDFAQQEYLTETLMDTWKHLKDEYPEIYNKYYSQYGRQE